jgi:metallo-beta-lactamase class B
MNTVTQRFTATLGMIAVTLLFATSARAAPTCKQCAAWNRTQQPFKIYGNTYYVGVRGLSSILITSAQGHILIDGALQESAPRIAANIRSLGFRVEDVKLILNSHVHHDHAGGIAELQRLTGATVAASTSSARVLEQGHSGTDDPLYGVLRPIPPVSHVGIVKDGEALHIGPLELTAHLTPGHTPGGTSWTWTSCENKRCLNIVYADSLTAVAAEGFRYTHNARYPNVLTDFQKSFDTVGQLPCDILLTPHPDMSETLSARIGRGGHADGSAPFPKSDTTACRRYAESARENLSKKLERESAP